MTYEVVRHSEDNIAVSFSVINMPFDAWNALPEGKKKKSRVVLRVYIGQAFTEETAHALAHHVENTLKNADDTKFDMLANTFLRTRHPKK